MSDPRRIVAYSDLLGFSELAVQKPEAASLLLSDFYNYAQNIKVQNSYEDLELFLFSDFLFVQGDRVERVVNYMCQLYRQALKHSAHSEAPMLIRGGVARGGVVTQQRREAPQVTKNFIVSPALTHAVKMESLVKGQRLLVSAKEREEIDHFLNSGINAVCYDQPSLKPSELFKKYRYQDLLWARDLSQPYADSRLATMKYIEISEKLYRENSQKPKGVVAHYAETLRICLLSYASLLEPCAADREFISRFVQETLIPHPNASVWIGFLECVLLSRHSFAFHDAPEMSSFLRHAVLAKEWGEVSTSLEQPEHEQLLSAVKEFISVAIPSQNIS
jgi:hypothetical protein